MHLHACIERVPLLHRVCSLTTVHLHACIERVPLLHRVCSLTTVHLREQRLVHECRNVIALDRLRRRTVVREHTLCSKGTRSMHSRGTHSTCGNRTHSICSHGTHSMCKGTHSIRSKGVGSLRHHVRVERILCVVTEHIFTETAATMSRLISCAGVENTFFSGKKNQEKSGRN